MKIGLFLMVVCGLAFVLSQVFRKKLENAINVTDIQVVLIAAMVISGLVTLGMNVS